MIPAFIIWLIRQYRQTENKKQFIWIIIQKINSRITQILAFVLLAGFLLLGFNTLAQTKQLNYQIIRGGNSIGSLHFTEVKEADITQFLVESEIKTRLIFSITSQTRDEATYYNGILLRSSVYRKQNGNEKVNKQINAGNNQYVIRSGDNSTISKTFPVTYNMLSLYAGEPVGIDQVFSDSFEQLIDIQKKEDHKYKIELPDGNYNYYCYEGGILNKVEVHHTLYSATIELIK